MPSQQVLIDLYLAYGQSIWPAQYIGLAVGVGWGLFLVRCVRWTTAVSTMVLAMGWAFVGLVFFGRFHGVVNEAAPYVVWGFCAEALLLLIISLRPGWLPRRETPSGAQWRGLAAIGIAILWPGLPIGHETWHWTALGWFGTAPDATAAATLGFLLFMSGKGRWLLAPIPLLWCVTSLLMQIRLDVPGYALVVPIVGVATVLIAIAEPIDRKQADMDGRGSGT